MPTFFIATGNGHKVDEIRAVLGPGFTVLSQRDAALRLEIEETGATFRDNALIKAATWAGYLSSDVCHLGADHVLADDSGLEVDALGGAPGVHSARFAALDDGRRGNSPDAENNAKLLRLLREVPPEGRRARFRCALALVPVRRGASPDPLAAAARFFEGACEGQIALHASGTGGFGYDPLFVPDGYAGSFAELGPEAKNALSHRARALRALQAALAAG
jgi:XTP/dITP diphosphohydrolase